MLIEARDLARSFGSRVAVAGVSFSVAAGEVVGFLGPNGAGKSTTLRLLTGYLAADRGSERIAGHDVARELSAARARLGYLPEAASGFQHLTGFELLSFVAEARGLGGWRASEALDRVTDMLGLAVVRDQTIGTLSKGWRQRVFLAQALLHDPPVLILDEPTDGLDPIQKAHLHGVLRRMAAERAVLMSSHILEEAEAICDRFIVIVGGRIVADARRADLVDEHGRLGPAFARLAGAADVPAIP